jgi:hypothetical protein
VSAAVYDAEHGYERGPDRNFDYLHRAALRRRVQAVWSRFEGHEITRLFGLWSEDIAGLLDVRILLIL